MQRLKNRLQAFTFNILDIDDKRVYSDFYDTRRENCVLLKIVQEFIEIKVWPLLIFLLLTQ